ncbi:MAG: protein kinase [Deltaproteobacteria bacterium]|nr:protein kinase [Deltaproteobacteria bacterium]
MTDLKAAPAAKQLTLSQELVLAKRVARGRLGVVYAAVHRVLARRFAVKVFRPELTSDPEVVERLQQILRETSALSHPAITPVIDFGEMAHERRVYLTMDFVHGGSLAHVLARRGRLEAERVLDLLGQLASGLAAAHARRIVHADLKPTNIMLSEEVDGREVLRINDFTLVPALASGPTDDDPFSHLSLLSTVEYLAPEQFARGRLDARVDVYAFGVLGYRMLTGRPPFIGTVPEVMEGHRRTEPVAPSRRVGTRAVGVQLDQLIMRCLEKDPADRFADGTELVEALRELCASDGEHGATIPRRTSSSSELAELGDRLTMPVGRLRRLFYDAIFELAELAVRSGIATEKQVGVVQAAAKARSSVDTLTQKCEMIEGRFEDIRAELRERETTLRHAIIELSLTRAERLEIGSDPADLEYQLRALETRLADVERERSERFTELNGELERVREAIGEVEQGLARCYRELHDTLVRQRKRLSSEPWTARFERLDAYRDALMKRRVTSNG